MGDLQPIIDAILNEARERAEETASRTEKIILRRINDFEEEKRRKRAEAEAESDREIAEIYERGAVESRQCVKNAELAVKAEFVKSAAELAQSLLSELCDGEYSDFLGELYKKMKIPEKSVVFLSERDKARVKKGTFGGAVISERTIDTGGGFVAEVGKISYDCTLAGIFEEKYNEICDAVGAILGEVRT